ncbi:MAG: hypothetical protein J0H12_04450 [Candidatus Paracaedimonas acanthamoebae]|uniref:ABC3 transporter permease C-terminal domain-containing protein n=1 Tax=Candidatus Paracaedimonas acanthamoebae TaxID=244581 RepID=A0A8J7TT96_9PROT|nr:hypothetical protein [Candidatus Paracaedimonas acanthamoebae]
MFKRTRPTIHSEIPFDRLKGSKMVFGTLGLMVFLITLCLSGTILLERFLKTWRHETIQGFTATLPSTSDPQEQFLQQMEFMKFLKKIPGVLHIEIITREKRTSIFDQWTYSTSKPPSSQAIEATFCNRVKISFSQIFSTLETNFPTIHLEVGRKSKETFLKIAQAAQFSIMILAGLIGIAAIFTIAFTTHAGLIIHDQVIEILRLIGAEDRFIAKQFQRYALNLAVKGGLLGCSLSALLYFLLLSTFDFSLLSLSSRTFPYVEIWGIIAFSPILVAIIIMISTRITVMLSLSQET